MNLLLAVLAFLLAVVLVLVGVTRFGVWWIERRYPPVGEFAEVAGVRLHYVHVPGPTEGDLPPVVFLHGASANLNDAMEPMRPLLEGRAEMLFVDRPGHGWSERGPWLASPRGQARAVAELMDRLGIGRAVIVGHSFGAAATAVFGVEMPERVAGLVFVSGATHPWPGAETSWYYRLTATPVIGWAFAETLALPGGWARLDGAVDCVFAPNPVPENYKDRARIPLVLRPSAFRANAEDVEGLHDFVEREQPRYREIRAPAVVISGNRDTVVFEEVHSLGMVRDVAGAELVWVENLGHKPDWVAPELVAGAVEKLAGGTVDLQAMARAVERRIAGDAMDVGRCGEAQAPSGELAPE
ncbi:MAG: alpha/beta hydrolase [Mesorhizobium amorphae]|nr:MAG: alpha/beta hydrolase [Mesorhizobium amorphae]